MYTAGEGVPQNCSIAMEWIKRSADQEHLLAQYELGQIYDSGKCGVSINDAEAFKWYTIVAYKGLSVANSNLGGMYEDGRGTEKDNVKAFSHYSVGASLGFWPAKAHLESLIKKMTAEQIMKAEKMAKEIMEKLPENAKTQ